MQRLVTMRKAEKIGLPSRVTQLPYVLWLLRARPGMQDAAVQITPTAVFADPALYAVEPWFHYVSGPYRWLELATLGSFVHDNLPIIQMVWHGSQEPETQQAENRRIAAALKPLPAHLLAWAEDIAARMAPGSANWLPSLDLPAIPANRKPA